VIRAAIAFRWVSVARQDDVDSHFVGTVCDGVEVVYLEPQQYTISVWLVFTIADGAVMVFDCEAVQLEDKLAVRDQALIFAASVITSAAEETLIPAAACFDVSYCDERLRIHRMGLRSVHPG
jgi:hypothetical protein